MKSDGRRVARVEKEVQQAIARYLVSHSSLSEGALLTVSRVIMPGDLRSAKVFISILKPTDDHRPDAYFIDHLQSRAFDAQDFINSELKLRYCPKLKFFLDETTEKILYIEKVIDQMKDPRKSPPNEEE